MNIFVLDSYALIRFFRKEPNYEVVQDLLIKIADGEAIGFISAFNVGEVYYMLCRKANINVAESAMVYIKQFPIQIIDADLEFSLAAAKIKAKHSISYADAFAAALTINKKATLITGDAEFKLLLKEPNFKVKFL
ncbi:MAG TPA: type II toxin-antitoxin system VapC family toxin [Puia sp.]|jgi:predicted nucleic acid-binding protein